MLGFFPSLFKNNSWFLLQSPLKQYCWRLYETVHISRAYMFSQILILQTYKAGKHCAFLTMIVKWNAADDNEILIGSVMIQMKLLVGFKYLQLCVYVNVCARVCVCDCAWWVGWVEFEATGLKKKATEFSPWGTLPMCLKNWFIFPFSVVVSSFL